MRALWRASGDEHNMVVKFIFITMLVLFLALAATCAHAAPQRDSAPVLLCDRVLVPDWKRFWPDNMVQYTALTIEQIDEIWMSFGTACYPNELWARDQHSI